MINHGFKHSALPLFVSVGLHVAIVGSMLIGWQSAPPPKNTVTPAYVKATLVKLKAQTPPQKVEDKKPKVVDLTQKRKEQERLKKIAAEKKRKALQQQKEAQKKKEQEQRQKEARERKAREKAEQQKREQLRRQREQQAMEQALAAEQAAILEASYAQTAQSYMAAIAERIENNWSRPPSARNDMSCELLIKLVPTGRVINVDVVNGSGNARFDRSAIQAVKKAEFFPEVKSMPIEVFDRYYRELTLVFKPQDLRQ